jgi:glycosyltransferase involved in cell wall biosynthesis
MPFRVAIFVSFSGQGGVERMILNLCEGLSRTGLLVDLVLVKAESLHEMELPAGVTIVNLNARHTLTSLIALVRYLRAVRPVALLAAKDRAIKVAALARAFARVPVRLVGRLGTTVSAALEGQGRLRRAAWHAGMRRFYPRVDRIVAVSEGVAADVRQITGLSPGRVQVVRNPVWTSRLERLASEPARHPWFSGRSVPVILGAGRLTRQKDFPTLVRAFAQARAKRPCRLVILGDGRQRDELLALAKELGVADDVALPGFQRNPYAWLARASLFVLSSAWEGSPNVLTEALALGVPVVATDCPSGPREILAGGRYGKLVPVGDADALAGAMIETLERPLPRETLQEAARPYTLEASTSGYLEALGLTGGQGSPLRTE